MTKKVAVILSGCGRSDGSEIHESVLTLLALQRAGISYECFAPDIRQAQVFNHLTNQIEPRETRNALVEAARIARGEIKSVKYALPENFDAAVYPGGFGAALNISDFAKKGAECHVQADVLRFAQGMAAAKKPQGFICIAPVMISKIYGSGVKQTIGSDKETAAAITAMGGVHVNCVVNKAVVDADHKVVSTPAYMSAQNIGEVADGIDELVSAVLALT